MKYCVLEEGKVCTDCGECDVCDLDPNKICDNCCKCIESGSRDYSELKLSDFYANLNRDGEDDDEDVEDDESLDQELYPYSDTKITVKYNKNFRGRRDVH